MLYQARNSTAGLLKRIAPHSAQEIAQDVALPEKNFFWHTVSKRVSNSPDQGGALLQQTNHPTA